MAYLIAIDLGTTGCRSMVFDQTLRLLGSAYEEYALITPKPDWVEQDANLWWTLACSTMTAAIANSGVSGEEIRAIGVSAQGISVVPVDCQFRPLRTALSWMDTRAIAEEELLIAELGLEKTFIRTGKRIAATYTLPKILWIQRHQPELFSETDKLLLPLEFLTAKLTGRAVTDASMASGTLLYDIQNEVWDAETLKHYGIAPSMLAEVLPCGSVAGTVLPEVAVTIGLSPDCLVCVGAQDQRCAALGAGLAPGVITVSLGTAAAVCKLWNRCETETGTHVGWSPYVFSHTWVTEGVAGAAGASLRWLRDEIYRSADYQSINEEAQAAYERGSELLFLPYLCGPGFPRFDPASTGCFYGVTLATTRGDFALAVMQGVAFQIREILESMDIDGEAKQLVLFGGGVKSALWRQIFADALNLPVSTPENLETAGVGAAMLAGLGAGVFTREMLPKLSQATVCQPSQRADEANAAYRRFCKLEQQLESGGGASL